MIAITDREFDQLAGYIKSNYGISLKREKQMLMMGRLYNVLLQRNIKTFSDYYDYIVSDKTGLAAATLLNCITTNHTYFMREADHFNYFRGSVLPYLTGTMKGRDMRIWSAGCSSGEEPYTLAMIISDFLGSEKPLWDTKVLATDISCKALEKAVTGRYTNEEMSSVPLAWKNAYFKKDSSGNYNVSDRIKDEVIFRKFNLMDKMFPFRKKFHVIFCRNVMIYFDTMTKNDLVDRFYDATEKGGYLFIGHSESVNRNTTRYKYIMPAVYRKE